MRRHSTRLSQAHDDPDEGDGDTEHVASRWYPELGTVLDDRPDPGSVITVIGARRTANLYGTEQDDRNGQFNGEPGDTGVYWSEPGQQQWTQENEPQEPAPPPPWAMSPVMARLAELEEAAGLIGMSHHATSINGQQIDDHGDAPGHGSIPRAAEPNAYDDRSTEGDGDPKWDDPLDPAHKEEFNGATVGMYPEGISAGGGPGISVGPVTAAHPWPGSPGEAEAHLAEHHGYDPRGLSAEGYTEDELRALHDHHHEHEDAEPGDAFSWAPGASPDPVFGSLCTARVPWTPKERGTLHSWQENPPGATWGDFVPSSQFPFLRPGESQHGPEDEELRAEGSYEPFGQFDDHGSPESRERPWPDSMPEEWEPLDWTDIASEGEHRKGPSGWMHHTLSSRREAASDAEDRYWQEHLSAQHGWSPASFERARMRGENLADLHAAGHEAGLANHPSHAISAEQRLRAQRDLERENSITNMFGADVASGEGKDRPEGYGLAHPARGGYAGGDPMNAVMNNAPGKPVASPEHWEERDPARYRRMMSSLRVHAHDDPDDSLDDGPTSGDYGVGDEEDEDDDPSRWPAAGTAVNETSRAMTQGRYDGKIRRGGGEHLAAFVAASGSPAFRFEFTAAWQDVIAKAKRIRAEGHVRITHASAGMVIGEVRGDHDTYESGLQRPVGRRQSIQHWACGCPWASFHQDKSAGTRYAGRPCSHVMALQFEAQSRGMFGRQVSPDEGLPQWSPPTVVVKSMPPWEGEPHAGRWREEWRAPVAGRRAAGSGAEERRYIPFEPDRGYLDEEEGPLEYPEEALEEGRSGEFQPLAPHWGGAIRRVGTPDDVPCQRATAALLRSGTDPVEVDALRMLAGLGPVTADSANGPWGSDNTVSHPPQKPYGATSPPDRDMDPGSYGPLAAPDPENWGRIDAGDVFQMPIGNTAARQPVPGDLHWPDQSQDDQGTFSYQDHANAAGPSTAMTPRDPNGIRMEESRGIDNEGHQVELDPIDGWQHLDGSVSHDDGTTVSDHPVRAELYDEPEAALPSTTGDDLEATAAADGTMGGGDAGDGVAQEAPLDTAALGEFGASAREEFRRKFGGPTAMGDQSVAEGLSGGAQEPSVTGQQPGMGSMDEPLMPDDQSIQTIGLYSDNSDMSSSYPKVGAQQWSGGGSDSDEGAVEPGQPQGSIDDIVASFQRSAAARAYTGGGGSGGAAAAEPGDIAGAARAYLAKTAEVLPQAEADELIREGRGQRARNLDLLNLEGTHYEDEDGAAKTGVNMDDYEDDVIFA